MELVDTHCHLDQDDFDVDRDGVVERAAAAGVVAMVAVGTTAASSAAACELAAKYDRVYAAVGIHPNSCAQVAADEWSRTEALVHQPRVVALGETGLDFYRDWAPAALQEDYFDRHLRLSQATGLPFIVHTRSSEQRVMEMLRDATRRGPLRGIMHSFTGDWAMAEECLALGMHISFAGMVTFKKSSDLRDAAARVPLDRLLIETDSPYLSPEPLRGKRNEPAHVAHTAARLAAARGMAVGELAAATTANARRLFGFQA